MRRPLAIAFLCSGALGCAGFSAERGHDTVGRLVEERTGYATGWDKGPPSSEQIARAVDDLLQGGLSRDRAVQIALVNAPGLQSAYEDLGVSQADLVQAGLLPNPRLSGSVGFVQPQSFGQTEYEASLVEDFLGIFTLPMRKRVAGQQFLADTLRVAEEAMRTAARVERLMAELEARAQMVELRRSVLEGSEAAAELATEQQRAGNITDLTLTREQAALEQARLDLERDELALTESREDVNRALGLWGPRTGWVLGEKLADLPREDPSLDHLEARAVAQRLDVQAARIQEQLLSDAVALARDSRYFGVVEIGAHVHQDADGPRLVGPTLSIELPIFDQRQAVIARLEAQHRQAVHRLDEVSIDTRSEVRVAWARLTSSRRVVERYKGAVLPTHERAVAQAQLHYNAMQLGPFELVATRQAQIEAYRAYLDAVRDYWMAHADLELAAGGRLSAKGSQS
ncbi:MAG: TolC family protein [Myxococcales bacterium]|nr:TolC family protein [Myxococcales bacterium]